MFGNIVFCVLFILSAQFVTAQQITINELYNSSSTDEWLELLVVQDALDLRDWDLRDFSSGGTAQTPLSFTTNTLWSSLAKGTIIVVGTSTTTFTEDTDPSDYLLMIKANNSLYFNAAGVFLFAGSSDAIQIRNASDTHVFGISWGASNLNKFSQPDVHFGGSMSSARTIFFNEGFVPDSTTSNWTFNSATITQGVGNTANNIAWLNTLRANTTGDGSGTATMDPDTVYHGNVYKFQITYHRDTAFTVTDLRILVPSNFSWSHTTGDISYSNMTATTSVSGDTVYFNAITFNADSTIISIQSVTAPDSTATYSFYVQTKALSEYKNITPTPTVVAYGLPQTIAEIKGNDANGVMLRVGQLVTFSGIVTVANQFGGPSYVQDNTGGIGIFGSSFSTAVAIGDEVIVTGRVEPFNGLSEIVSPVLQSIVSSGNTISPTNVTCSQLKNDGAGGVENFEGLLVRVNTATVRDTFNNTIPSWAVSGSGTNYRLIDASGFVDIRVDNNVDFANTPAPQGTFDVIGVLSQFKTSSPFIGGYQMMPRYTTDIISEGPLFATLPIESNITSSSFHISWTTVNNGTTRLRYGIMASYELGVLEPDNTLRTSHAIDITGLQPATIYHVQAFSVANGDTSNAGDLVVITASPPGSTGAINAYFNKSVNTSVAIWENALGNQDLVSRLTTRINNAKRSIDVSLYSLSGSSQGDVIASALINAKNRGVKVRIICEHDNVTSNAFSTLQSSGIPFIDDSYDLVTGGAGLMHNKFMVFDVRGGAPESVWVWSGSWNPTIQGTTSDRQNSIEIQDVSLAIAYNAEFNEMWGSSSDLPNQSNSRFGFRKTDNTPHHFVINSVPVELYFSPSDNTTTYIGKTIRKAQASVAASLLTCTRKDLADSVIASKNAGKKTRMLLDNNTDTNNQFAYLQSNGIDVHLKGGSGLLHHKYAIVDADQVNGTQYALTGSHNWSNSAENSNDENTLIIQDGRMANLYLQEFAARYYEAGGTDSIEISSSALFSVSPASRNFGDVNVGLPKDDSVIVTNNGNVMLNISSVSSSNAKFSVLPTSASVAAFSSQTFVITFSPDVNGIQSGNIIFTHNAPGSPDTATVQGNGVGGGGNVKVNTSIASGWNMVSLPVQLSDSRKIVAYPAAISSAFAYEGAYVTKDTLLNGIGYWLKFDTSETASHTGLPVTSDTISVVSSWNMIGSLTNPVPISSIIENPTSNVASNYFGYSGSYYNEDTLKPGLAYWVKVNQAGTLMLSSSEMKPVKQPKPGRPPNLQNLNRLTFTDARGYKQTLYFGETTPCDGCQPSQGLVSFELPPLPPEGGFDVRFASGRLAELFAGKEQKNAEYPISIQSSLYPLKIDWAIETEDVNKYTLVSSDGAVLQRMTGSGELVVHQAIASLTLNVAEGKPLPTSFVLGQNYPNPFNPTTTIPFALPRASTVTLKLYNMLGEEVMTMLDNISHGAGYYDITINAVQLSSGMYFYRLSVLSNDEQREHYQSQRKLLLIK